MKVADCLYEYEIVLLTDDANTALRVAEFDNYDATHARWVKIQPYQVGLLLSSSNAALGRIKSGSHFRLLCVRFTESVRTVDLGSVTATSVSYLITLANVECSDTDVQITQTEQDGTIALSACVTGPFSVKALLSESVLRSPFVLYLSIRIVLCNMFSITYEALMTGNVDVRAYIQKAVAFSNGINNR